MDELDTLRRAQTYIAQLAQGVDPISGEEVGEDALLNNPRLIRCFFYVAGVLAEDVKRMERGGGEKKPRKSVFFLTPEERGVVPVSETPIGISVFMEGVNATAGEERKRLPVTAVTAWLLEKGFLKELEGLNGKRYKSVTPQAASVGIVEEERQNSYGLYHAILYSADAQRFILDNLDDIIALREEKR